MRTSARLVPCPGARQASGVCSLVLIAIGCVSWTPSAPAVNGFFLTGYGPQAVGVGGVGVAMPQDRMAAAVNPAGMALVDPGFDFNIRLIHPQRSAGIDCRGIGACDEDVSDRSDREFFVVPHIGYSKRVGERTTFGITMYVNGGLNTSYGRGFYDEAAARILGARPGDPGVPSTDKLGIDFSQMIFAPSLSHRYSERLTLGISPLFVVQRWAATGLNSFGRLSVDPTSMSNRGTEYALGTGVRIGLIMTIAEGFRIGVQYTSRLYMQHYSEYNGLFPDGGTHDSPPHYTLGFAWDINRAFTFGFDFQQIQFATVDVFGNPGPTPAEVAGVVASDRRFGGSRGFGFGWSNQSVYKAGLIYRMNARFDFRAGWNYGDALIPEEEALFNLLAPSMLRHHMTLGMSFKLKRRGEVSIAYMHAFADTMRDPESSLLGAPARAWAAGDALDLGYSIAF